MDSRGASRGRDAGALSRITRPLVWALPLVLGCGARSGLRDEGAPPVDSGTLATDVPPEDVLPTPPSCGVEVPVGSVRFTIPGVTGRVAVDERGVWYAPRATATGGREVAAIDPCGRLLWVTPVVEPTRGGRFQHGTVRLGAQGEVLLTDVTGDTSGRGVYRLRADGTLLAPYSFDGTLGRFLALPPGRGPIVALTSDGGWRLVAHDLGGRVTGEVSDWSNVNECAVTGTTVACLDGAVDLATRTRYWTSAYEILDGTLRHALPPAVDGDRVYVALFGISTYALTARAIARERTLWRLELARSVRGQTDLVMGAPVIGTTGLVYVYVNVHRASGPDGELVAVTRDGAVAWRYAASATAQEFLRYETHVAGRAGVVYLAVGRTLHAVGDDGRARWTLALPGGANRSLPSLSPLGDLALHTDDDRLVVVATESAGLARSPWPVVGGDGRNGNAR